ncbi:hypothetical protein [Leclercia adecarboxylata]|uniref:hypothetical protein n=1 Tax=Leclercia adecarboxylata TaxID=83655 RepID=UPI003D99B227
MLDNSIVFEVSSSEAFGTLSKSEVKFSYPKPTYFNSTVNIDYKTVGNKASGDILLSKELHSLAAQETENYAHRVFSSIRNNELKFGYGSQTQTLISDLLNNYKASFVDDILVKTLALHILPSSKPLLMCKFLVLISAFEAETLPLTCTMAVTSLSHKKYTSVKESLLMTIEVLKFKGALPLLKDMEPYSRKYLEEYRQKVIKFLEVL